jgi:hypothetical protein
MLILVASVSLVTILLCECSLEHVCGRVIEFLIRNVDQMEGSPLVRYRGKPIKTIS